MDQKEMRLTECFFAVFPELARDVVIQASSASVESWDSVATVTLLSVIEAEFGINIDVEDLVRFDSFKGILGFLRETEKEFTQRSFEGDAAV